MPPGCHCQWIRHRWAGLGCSTRAPVGVHGECYVDVMMPSTSVVEWCGHVMMWQVIPGVLCRHSCPDSPSTGLASGLRYTEQQTRECHSSFNKLTSTGLASVPLSVQSGDTGMPRVVVSEIQSVTSCCRNACVKAP